MSATRSKRLDWHPDAIAELAESLAWYATTKRMRKVVEDVAHFLIASPIAVSGRLGVVTGTRELPVGDHTPFTLIFSTPLPHWQLHHVPLHAPGSKLSD